MAGGGPERSVEPRGCGGVMAAKQVALAHHENRVKAEPELTTDKPLFFNYLGHALDEDR